MTLTKNKNKTSNLVSPRGQKNKLDESRIVKPKAEEGSFQDILQKNQETMEKSKITSVAVSESVRELVDDIAYAERTSMRKIADALLIQAVEWYHESKKNEESIDSQE